MAENDEIQNQNVRSLFSFAVQPLLLWSSFGGR